MGRKTYGQGVVTVIQPWMGCPSNWWGTLSACIFIVDTFSAGRDLRLLSVDAFSVMCQQQYHYKKIGCHTLVRLHKIAIRISTFSSFEKRSRNNWIIFAFFFLAPLSEIPISLPTSAFFIPRSKLRWNTCRKSFGKYCKASYNRSMVSCSMMVWLISSSKWFCSKT